MPRTVHARDSRFRSYTADLEVVAEDLRHIAPSHRLFGSVAITCTCWPMSRPGTGVETTGTNPDDHVVCLATGESCFRVGQIVGRWQYGASRARRKAG
jgi:hypothetical protein